MTVIRTARRKAAAIVALGAAPLALTGLSAAPAAAHGSLTGLGRVRSDRTARPSRARPPIASRKRPWGG